MRFIYTPPFATRRTMNVFFTSTILVAIAFFVCCIHLQNIKHHHHQNYQLPKFHTQQIIEAPTLAVEHPITASPKLKLAEKVARETNKTLAIKTTHKHFFVKNNDNLSSLLLRANVAKPLVYKIVNNKDYKKHHTLAPGSKIDFVYANKELQKINIPLTLTQTLKVNFVNNHVALHYETKPIKKKTTYIHNYIKGSLYNSALKAGLSTKTVMQLAEIFSCDIDFALDIRENDYFKLIYEEEFVDDKKIDSGHIVAAEFYTQGQLYRAIRFQDSHGNIDYYSPEGFSLKKAFLRTPVKFTHISSHFNSGRKHPILHRIRAHKGVDYAAPHGTPVKSAGNGKITFVGSRGGYGKTIEIQHGNKYSTLYAHLSRYAPLKTGQTIKQGDIIGYVGSTGLASGAHLHYEFRINGIHHNPITAAIPKQPIQLSKQQKHKFFAVAQTMINKLNTNKNTHPRIAQR